MNYVKHFSVAWEIHSAVPQTIQYVTEVASTKTTRRCQEMSESLRDGAQRAVVHAMQMEKGMHKIWGRCLDYNLVLFEIL